MYKYVWEDKGEKVEDQQRAWDREQKESQSGSQIPIKEAKKVAVAKWWKALGVEGAKVRSKDVKSIQELSEMQAKLREAEQTITDMREQVCHLQASLRLSQEHTEQKNTNRVLHTDKGSNTERKEEDKTAEKEARDQKDASVVTDPVSITDGAASEQDTTDRLLATLRRMEAMVNNALETAQLVRKSEQRVSQVRVKMEGITHRVEEALGRAANTDEELNMLEARITENAPTQVCLC